jgi:hypothetical protein
MFTAYIIINPAKPADYTAIGSIASAWFAGGFASFASALASFADRFASFANTPASFADRFAPFADACGTFAKPDACFVAKAAMFVVPFACANASTNDAKPPAKPANLWIEGVKSPESKSLRAKYPASAHFFHASSLNPQLWQTI